MGLRRELSLQHRVRLDLAEEDMSEQEVALGGVGMVFEVLADGAVGFGELVLLEKGFSVGKKVLCLSGGLGQNRPRGYLAQYECENGRDQDAHGESATEHLDLRVESQIDAP